MAMTAVAAASEPDRRSSKAPTSGVARRRARGSSSRLGALLLLVGVCPCHVQAGKGGMPADAAGSPQLQQSAPGVVSERALHEEDEGAAAGEMFKRALRANLRRLEDSSAPRQAPLASAVEDTPRSSPTLLDRVVAESALVEALAGARSVAAAVEEADVLPAVEMESSISDEDTPAEFVWGSPRGALRGLSDQGTVTETSTTTATSTTTGTTTSATTTTVPGGEAPAPSPSTFETRTGVEVSFLEEPADSVLEVLCDGLRFVVANETGISEGLIECVGFTFTLADLQGAAEGDNRRLTGAGTVKFDLKITSESEAEASRVNTEVSDLVPAEVTTALQTQIQNDATVSDEVKNVVTTVEVLDIVDVITERAQEVRAMRGAFTVTVTNTGYTNEQVIDFITDMLVQALESTANTNVDADNITISVDTSTSIRFTILSYEAAEDVAILDALSQSDTVSVLQAILNGSNVEITIDAMTVNWKVYGTLTIVSGAASDTDQQKLTDSSVWSLDLMSASLSAAAQALYGLVGTEVGIHLLDKVAYAAGVNTSNRIVFSYSFEPSTFSEYCSIASQTATAASQATLESSLTYENSDPTVLPRFESFIQDPVLAACTESSPAPSDEDDTSTADPLIIAISLAVAVLVICMLVGAYFVLKRRRQSSDDASGALTHEDHEAGRHGSVPESTIQVHLPSVAPSASGVSHAGEVMDDEPRQVRGMEELSEAPSADGQLLEYLDDDFRLDAV